MRCRYFYAKWATGELRYISLNRLSIIMNTKLLNVLNKKKLNRSIFGGNCHGKAIPSKILRKKGFHFHLITTLTEYTAKKITILGAFEQEVF